MVPFEGIRKTCNDVGSWTGGPIRIARISSTSAII